MGCIFQLLSFRCIGAYHYSSAYIIHPHIATISPCWHGPPLVSYNPSSIRITLSLFMLILTRSSISSLDSTSQLFSTLVRLHLYGETCRLPNYFTLFPFHLLSYKHTPLQPFHHIRQLCSSSRHRPNFNIQTAHSQY